MMQRTWPVPVCWAAAALVLAILAGALVGFGDHFAWARDLRDVPAVALALASVLGGCIFLALSWLIPATIAANLDGRSMIALIIIVGFGLRFCLLWSTPALEDDFYRYLWDGGVVAHGFNPYKHSPDTIFEVSAPPRLQALAASSGAVIERINHPQLKTIYPPVAQLWFALAHLIEPWSLIAWRSVALIGELISLALIFDLLRRTGRSLIWSALYWWNPVVIKELINSAHMEAVLLPVVVLALWLGVRGRYVLGCVALAFAVGTKLWPVMLYPLLLRPLLNEPPRFIAAVLICGGLIVAWAVPPYLGGLDQTSGFVAFAQQWQTNSALFQQLQAWVGAGGEIIGLTGEAAGMLTRLALAAIVGLIALKVSQPVYRNGADLITRAAWVVGAQFLLSPVQFPCYATWIFVLLPFVALPGLLAITATIPLYYLSFHFAAHGRYDLFNAWVLWFIWVPVWALLARDAWRAWRHPLAWRSDA